MPTPFLANIDLAALARRAVKRTIAPARQMSPPQVAAVLRRRSRHLDIDGLRDLIEANIESERQSGERGEWGYDNNRLIALRQALVATGSDGFETAWNEWRSA